MKQILEALFLKNTTGTLFCKDYKFSISEKVSDKSKVQLEQILHDICSDFAEKETDRIVKKTNDFAAVFPELITEEEKEEALQQVAVNLENGQYPVLYNKMKDACDLFVKNCNALADRLNANKEEIEKVLLNGSTITEIRDIDFVSRESLCGSSALNIIVITNAGKFFYKPHDCTLDYYYHELNKRYFSNIFRTPAVVKGSYDYGFCEFMYNKVATTASDAAKFYENMGSFSAVLCFTQGQDCHIKNVFANGIYPVPIDFEMIVYPSLPKVSSDLSRSNDALEDLRLSVAVRGVLPCQSPEGREYSPLLDTPGEEFNCAPLVNGKRVTVLDYENEFKAGFEKTFIYCLKIKDKLLEWFDELGEAHIRHIYGQKQLHGKVSGYLNSHHALLSEDAQQKYIQRATASIQSTIGDERIASECVRIDAMGELPYFYAQMKSKSLFSSFGMELKDYFAVLPVESVKNTVRKQNEEFLKFNLTLIDQSFADCIIKEQGKKEVVYKGASVKQRIDDLYVKIKNHFIETPSGSKILIGQFSGNSLATPNTIGGDGKMGIALFLKTYASCYSDTEYGKDASVLADQLIRDVLVYFEYFNGDVKLGDCEGLSGTLKCALLINRIEKSPEVSSLIEKICKKISEFNLNRPVACDKYAGLAGLISVYCNYEELPDRKETVTRLADRLLELKTYKHKDMTLWDTASQKKVLSGAAHGMIGLFQALFLAYELTGKTEYKTAALDAYKFENDCYSEELGTWPDFRDTEEPVNAMHGFCSGAPGIGSIILSMNRFKDIIPNYDENLKRAVESCMRQIIMYRDHICCGNGAVADFMIDLYNTTGKEEYMNRAKELMITDTEYAFLPITHRNSFVIGLYFGACGVGYELLRILNPTKIPSVLV